MQKRILLIGYNFSPEPTGIGKYSGEMMYWLARNGYACTVVASYPFYPQWRVQEPYRKNRFGYKTEVETFESGGSLKIIRCPIYVPSTPSGAKRMLLDMSFMASAGLVVLKYIFKKPFDVVFCVAPPFILGLLGVIYKKIRGAKFVYHIQDLQIEAARDLGMIRSKSLLRFLFKFERFILKNADRASSISDGMLEKISTKSNTNTYFFPNWSDTEKFKPLDNRSDLKKNFGFETHHTIALYSGGIGQKQGLENILYAADALEKSLPELQFIICGSGPYRETLENVKNEMGLANVHFMPLQPIEIFNEFLNMADIHLVIQKAGAADLMMPSKLATILSVGGLALITANPGSGLHTLVENHRVAHAVDAEDLEALQNGLKDLVGNLTQNDATRKAARAYAEKYINMNSVMERLSGDLIDEEVTE